jgi:hypothetical protein
VSSRVREDVLVGTLVDVAVESWRFLRAMERVVASLDADQQRRAGSRFHYFQQRLADALGAVDLRLVQLDGAPFGPGLAATAVNAADFGPQADLVVDQTLEPVVLGPEGVVRLGTVTLRRADP